MTARRAVLTASAAAVLLCAAAPLRPPEMALSPDGTFVYSANFDGGDVSTIDVATRSAGDQDISVATAPAAIAFTPCAATPAPPPPTPPAPVVVTPAFTG